MAEHSYNPFSPQENFLNSEENLDWNLETPTEPAKPVKTRKRGFSLRTQMMNNNIQQQAENYLDQLTPSVRPSILNRNSQVSVKFQEPSSEVEDIELRQVDNSYKAGDLDVFRNNEDSSDAFDERNRSFQYLTNESVIDLGREPDDIFGAPQKFTRPSPFKRIFNILTGAREELPSMGGRKIPITIDFARCDFPVTKSKNNKLLLIDERRGQPYTNNTITSSRYTIYSFFPRQLIAQFSKLANCYFMIVAILQLIPSWSTTGTSTTIIPLSIFISISILREGYDDIRRHKLDKQENNRITRVLKEYEAPESLFQSDMRFSKSTTSFSRLRPSNQSFDFNLEDDTEIENLSMKANSFENEELLLSNGITCLKTKWKDLKVGDIIKLECDEWIPADIVLLSSSNDMGEVFVETMALDGETNLKSKIPNQDLHKLANKAKSLDNITGTILSEDPNLDLYNFEGSLQLPDLETQEMKKYPLGPENIIYRGSILRNTDCCIGVVVFTGEESKIRMNAIKNPRIKAPKLQRKINMIVAFMVFVVLSLSCFSLMAERLFYKEYKDKNWYVYGEDAGIAATIMGFIIMFNTMIPLSLYVTMEIIKVMQMFLLQWDIDMYHPESNTPAEAHTATILEELGQVSYIFSDKTGTLTDNLMLFRKFSVCGTPWIHDIDLLVKEDEMDSGNENIISPINRTGSIKFTGRPSMASLSPAREAYSDSIEVLNKENPKPGKIRSSLEFIKYLQTNPNTIFSKKSTFFILSIALCHTCLPRKVQKDERDSIESLEGVGADKNQKQQLGNQGDFELDPFADDSVLGNDDDVIEYQAASPDELALVQAASDMGFIFYERKQKRAIIKTYPNGFEEEPVLTEYEILDIVEFSSARKRMSIIIRFPNNKIVMFCKGADNVIIERLNNSNTVKGKQSELIRSVSQRKKAEADFILNRRSNDMTSVDGRPSLSSLSETARPSLSIRDRAPDVTNTINSILDGDEVNDIYNDARISIEFQQNEKYKLNGSENYIPSDNLLLNEGFIIDRTLQHIELFSSDGLRTLLYSYRYLDEKIFNDWQKRYSEAKTAIINRGEKVEKIGAELECDLNLLGCTAIEDKLQGGVPEAIEKLRRAGIKMWMLTGDKRETAINIGYSCRLIKDYSKVVILSNENDKLENLGSIMAAAELEIDEGNVAHCVVVVDGSTLSDIENDITLMTLFISLGIKTDSVICCRASPSQKATMVLKVREIDTSKVTLAIGDGANDIAMIQSADVGIGITGKEGLQAARTSDYSIAQFRYLLKLLLVHGRYNYIRTSKFVLCTFYKELLFYLSQLLYQRYTLFTGSSLYESWSLSMFNTLFTSLPVLCIGMFDKDLKQSTLIAIPELYVKGRKNETFNLKVFIIWVLLAGIQSTTLCFVLWNIYGFAATIDNTTYPLGVIMFTVLIIIINTKCNIIEMHSITKLSIISWNISVIGWIVWCLLLVGLYKSKLSTIFYVQNGLTEHFGTDITFWGSILLLCIIGIWIDFLFNFVRHFFYKTDTEIFQVLEKDNEIRKKIELNSYEELKQSWTWLHESQIIDSEINDYSNFKRNIHNFRSFMKKGSTNPSKSIQMRKRKTTMVNSNEPLPNSPSIVTLNSSDNWTEEMLPSGKIIRIRKNSNGMNNISNRKTKIRDIFSFKRGNNGNDGGKNEDEENIDDILNNRNERLYE